MVNFHFVVFFWVGSFVLYFYFPFFSVVLDVSISWSSWFLFQFSSIWSICVLYPSCYTLSCLSTPYHTHGHGHLRSLFSILFRLPCCFAFAFAYSPSLVYRILTSLPTPSFPSLKYLTLPHSTLCSPFYVTRVHLFTLVRPSPVAPSTLCLLPHTLC